jgi:PAS domain S-box-containing protein
MDSINPMPWIMDAEGNSLHMSLQWVPATQLIRKRMPNLGWLEALHLEDLYPTMKIMREALKSGKPINIKYRVTNFDGDWKWMRSRGLARFNADDEITRWYGDVEDIDQRKQNPVVTTRLGTDLHSQ